MEIDSVIAAATPVTSRTVVEPPAAVTPRMIPRMLTSPSWPPRITSRSQFFWRWCSRCRARIPHALADLATARPRRVSGVPTPVAFTRDPPAGPSSLVVWGPLPSSGNARSGVHFSSVGGGLRYNVAGQGLLRPGPLATRPIVLRGPPALHSRCTLRDHRGLTWPRQLGLTREPLQRTNLNLYPASSASRHPRSASRRSAVARAARRPPHVAVVSAILEPGVAPLRG